MNACAFGSPAGINPPDSVSLQKKSLTSGFCSRLISPSKNFSPINLTTSSNKKDIFRGLQASCSGNAERLPVQRVTKKSKTRKVDFSTEFLRRIIKTLPAKSNLEDVSKTVSDASPCSGTLVKDTNAETNVGISSKTDLQWVDMLSAIFTGKLTLDDGKNTGSDASPRPGTLSNETNKETLSNAGLTDKSISEDVTKNTGSDASPRQETLVNETNSERPSSVATQSSKLDHHDYQIIRYPVVTESALKAILECNTLVFVVDKDADKKSIKEAVTKMLKITIKKVNTLLTPEGTKKAYVMLKPGCNALDVAKKMNWL